MARMSSKMVDAARQRRSAPLATPSDLAPDASRDIAGAMNAILADVFALYLKTKKLSLAHERAALSRLPSVAG